jgi:hypothetical protein
MLAIAVAEAAPDPGVSPTFLCDDFLSPRERGPRGPLEPWCATLARRLGCARADTGAHLGEISSLFDEAAHIAALLDRNDQAGRLRRAAIAFLAAAAERGGGPAALWLALFQTLALGRVEHTSGRIDDALFTFERLAALPLGGSVEQGPLAIGPRRFDELASFSPDLPRALSAAAIIEALEVLLQCERYDVVLSVAQAREPGEDPALCAFRREATAAALCRMDLPGEALVFLASAVAREAPSRRPIFEQKRAEALAAFGQTEAAHARALTVGEKLLSRLDAEKPSLDDLRLAARVSRLLSLLSDPFAISIALRARSVAREKGDVPLEAELALHVVEAGATGAPRAQAMASLCAIALESGHRIAAVDRALAREGVLVVPTTTAARAPSFSGLCEALLSLAPSV